MVHLSIDKSAVFCFLLFFGRICDGQAGSSGTTTVAALANARLLASVRCFLFSVRWFSRWLIFRGSNQALTNSLSVFAVGLK